MNDKKRRLLIVCIALFILLGAFFSILVADMRARRSAAARAEEVLLDSAREQAGTFAATMSGSVQTLKSMAAALELSGPSDAAETERLLDYITESAGTGFFSVDLIYPDGSKATADESYTTNVSQREYFKSAMAGQTVMQYMTGLTTGKQCVALAAPYYENGRVCGVIRGLYYEEELRALLTSHAYGGKGYSCLICSCGDIIINAENEELQVSSANIFDALAGASFSRGGSLGALEARLASGQDAAVHYTNGVAKAAVFVPLDSPLLPENDWYILNIINESELRAEILRSTRNSAEAVLVFAAFAAAAVIFFLILEHELRKSRRLENELTRQREEQFRIVTRQSGKFVMRYDIPARTAYMDAAVSDGFSGEPVYPEAPESIVARGVVAPVSIPDYKNFFARIDAGESPLSEDFLMALADGSRRWYKHVSTTIFDEDGRPRTAVIAYFDDTEQRERELAYARWQQELDRISLDQAALYEWNLTKDLPEGQRGQLMNEYVGQAAVSFNQRTAVFARERVFEEDRPAFEEMMNRERLIAGYFSKQYSRSLDYRFVSGGGLSWRRISVQLVPYPNGQDIKAYVTNKDIDADKRSALDALTRSQHDFLTGALNRETFIRRVENAIAAAPEAAHAIMMLDVDGFKRVNDTLGHAAGDRVLRETAELIRSALRAGDLVGRIGGDEFMVFLPDMPGDGEAAKKAEQLRVVLERRLEGALTVSASIGAALYPRDGSGFAQLYKCADDALYRAKNSGKNSFAFYRTGLPGSAGGTVSAIDPVPDV